MQVRAPRLHTLHVLSGLLLRCLTGFRRVLPPLKCRRMTILFKDDYAHVIITKIQDAKLFICSIISKQLSATIAGRQMYLPVTCEFVGLLLAF